MMKKGFLLLICILLLSAITTAVHAESAAETAPPATPEPAPAQDQSFGLTLDRGDFTVDRGKTIKVTARLHNVADPMKVTKTWTSSDPSVATVVYGAVKGKKEGKTTITCTAVMKNGPTVSAQLEVTVRVPVQSVRFASSKALTLRVGEAQQMEYRVNPSDATDPSLEWSSSNPSVATVDNRGVVTGVGGGKATITARALDGSERTGRQQVHVPSIQCSTYTLFVSSREGNSFTFHYSGDNWEQNIATSVQKNNFTFNIHKKGDDLEVTVFPVTVGKGTLIISDRKDPDSKARIEIRVTSSAVPLDQFLQVKAVRQSKDSFYVTFVNNSGMEIQDFDIRFIPYNKEGQQLFLSDKVGGEIRHYAISKNVRSGKNRIVKLVMAPYAGVEYMDIALVALRLADGTHIEIPESALYWYSFRKKGYLDKPEGNAVNCYPTAEELQKDGSFRLGYIYSEVTPELASYYGYRNAGSCVTEVEPGSLAEKAGLKEQDLIISADGVKIVDDSYAVNKAKARIADGGSFMLTVERPGEKEPVDLVITK